MAFIVNGVCRFTIEQSMEGNEIANILDVRIDTTGSTMSRDEAIQDQAEIILENWAEQILPIQSNQLALDAVRWLDLDSATGSTGETTTGGTYVAPVAGGTTTSALPTNTAALVRKTLESAGRGRRSGRMYLCGISEAATNAGDGNTLSSAEIASMNARFDLFLQAVNQNAGTFADYDSAACVVHVVTRDADGKPLTGTSSDIGALTVDELLATQRRRLRR